MTCRRHIRRAITVCLAAAIVAGLSTATAAAATGPHISASPTSVMVNSSTTLVGRGFHPRTRLTIADCGATSWIVPQQYCSARTVTVTTSTTGSFRTAFAVSLCPHASGPATRKTCYLGVPQPRGVDTIELVGAARITVTYP